MQDGLISPGYDLKKFCSHMQGKDLLEIMDAIYAEINNATRLHRKATNQSCFRKGSKGRKYCENLQKIISMLMNGKIPSGSSSEFLIAVKPMILQLLNRYKIGNLREEFSKLETQEHFNLPVSIDPLVIVVSRKEVLDRDIKPALTALNRLLESPETVKKYKEKVEIAFHGYDDTTAELFEIDAVREYVDLLDNEFPYWLFFLSKEYLGLQCIIYCFLPPFLTDEGKRKHFPSRIGQYLMNRGFPAMNHICQYAELSEREIEELTERGLRYIEKGRFKEPDIDNIDIKIIHKFIGETSVPKNGQPEIVILFGPVCSGKTYARIEQYSAEYVLIDAGEIFKIIRGDTNHCFGSPSFENQLDKLGYVIAQEAVNNRLNIVVEFVGTEKETMSDIINAMSSVGYKISLNYIDCSPETAQQRNSLRTDDNISSVYTEYYHRRWLLEAAKQKGKELEKWKGQSVILLAGPSGGGKTTALKTLYASGYKHLDIDSIREEYGLKYKDAVEKGDELFLKYIHDGCSVIYETPFTHFASIHDAINLLLSHNGLVHIAFIDITVETSVVRTETSLELGERKLKMTTEDICDEYNHALPTFLEINKRYDGNSSITVSLRKNDEDLKNPKLVFTRGLPFNDKSTRNKNLIHEETVLSLEEALNHIYT